MIKAVAVVANIINIILQSIRFKKMLETKLYITMAYQWSLSILIAVVLIKLKQTKATNTLLISISLFRKVAVLYDNDFQETFFTSEKAKLWEIVGNVT